MLYNDSLYRVSLKCLITDPSGKVLVVRENGRGSWDLPGGGIDHGEDIRSAIARELEEELDFRGDFTFKILRADDPAKLKTRDVWQLKLVFAVELDTRTVSAGVDVEEIAFIDPRSLKDSNYIPEQMIYEYTK